MIKMGFTSQETRNKLNINVINMNNHISTDYDYYIGRPSVLSNPYTHKKDTKFALFVVDSRELAINNYSEYFNAHIKNDSFKNEITKILNIYKKYNKVNLLCFCKPKSCHGDYIKHYIENIILCV